MDRTAPGWEGTDRVLRYNSGSGGSTAIWHAALRCKLLQQTDDDFNSFQQSWVSVGSCSQKLGVNLLVGLEDCIFFGVTATVKNRQLMGTAETFQSSCTYPWLLSDSNTDSASAPRTLRKGTIIDHRNMDKEYMPSRAERELGLVRARRS